MKVIGSGAPRTLQVRLASSERVGFERALCKRRDELLGRLRAPASERSVREEDGRSELAALQRVADQLATAREEAGQALISGPTSVVGPVIEAASRAAAEELLAAVDAVRGGGSDALARLADAIGPGQAAACTLVGYRRIMAPDLGTVAAR